MNPIHQDSILQKTNQTIAKRLDDIHFSLGDLCEEVGYSYSHLHHIIKVNTGLTLSHYVREQRLMVAEELLVTTKMHIAQVCFAVGFKDPNYFTRVFKLKNGVTPKDWRDKYK